MLRNPPVPASTRSTAVPERLGPRAAHLSRRDRHRHAQRHAVADARRRLRSRRAPSAPASARDGGQHRSSATRSSPGSRPSSCRHGSTRRTPPRRAPRSSAPMQHVSTIRALGGPPSRTPDLRDHGGGRAPRQAGREGGDPHRRRGWPRDRVLARPAARSPCARRALPHAHVEQRAAVGRSVDRRGRHAHRRSHRPSAARSCAR